MDNSIFNFTYKKNKKLYLIITVLIFISILVMNFILQVTVLSIKTVSNEIINNPKLSLISFDGSDKNYYPYNYDIKKIKNLEHVKFVTESRPLMLNFNVGSDDCSECTIYAIDPQYAYYVGISDMKEDQIYLPSNDYKDLKNLKPDQNIGDEIKYTTFNGEAPMIIEGGGFVAKDTYDKIVKRLDTSFIDHVQPIYLIGVDKVENVFNVAKELKNLESDDDELALYQASGLENVVTDANRLFYCMIIALIVFIIFNTFVIIYLSSSLIGKIARDLMIIYLNGLSRKEISKLILGYIKKRIGSVTITACVLSILVFMILMKYLLNQNMTLLWLLILLGINVFAIVVNLVTFKIVIKKIVYSKTANGRISKILRN